MNKELKKEINNALPKDESIFLGKLYGQDIKMLLSEPDKRNREFWEKEFAKKFELSFKVEENRRKIKQIEINIYIVLFVVSAILIIGLLN